MARRSRRPAAGASRPVVLLAVIAAVVAAACGNEEPPPPDLASPSAACAEAFAEAGEGGERPAPASPRSPDLDALQQTLDACTSPAEWLSAARGNPSALPLELDRETALDQLCTGNPDTTVCQDWEGTEDGPAA